MKAVKNIKATYKTNKSAKVGETCYCPSCGQPFIKTSYQQAFCRTKAGTICKDKYWNTVIYNKRNNTTRISPASRRYMKTQRMNNRHTDIDHPFSCEGLGQWID